MKLIRTRPCILLVKAILTEDVMDRRSDRPHICDPARFCFRQTLTAKFLSTISLVHHLQAAYRISCITELSISVIASGTEKTEKFYVIVNAHEDGSKRKDRIEPIQ